MLHLPRQSLDLFEEAPPLLRPVSPRRELGAYEALWEEPGATFKRIADRFRQHPGVLPSDLVPSKIAESAADRAIETFSRHGLERFHVAVHQTVDYPPPLRDARHPVELLYYCGDTGLIGSNGVAVVGTRNPSAEGRRRTRKLVRRLVSEGYVIVSGLARGIDSEAHSAAIAAGGSTIAVIAKPLYSVYPPENADLHQEIATNHLLLSQVPALAYEKMSFRAHRGLFPERNATMSALSRATIIIEAGETSGTLTQARAALAQGRPLIILESCFKNSTISWPQKFLARGAYRVSDFDQIKDILGESARPEN